MIMIVKKHDGHNVMMPIMIIIDDNDYWKDEMTRNMMITIMVIMIWIMIGMMSIRRIVVIIM